MLPSRNFILLTGLTLFLLWYVSSWAYQTCFLLPRKELGEEIAKLSGEIQYGRQTLDNMTQFFENNKGLYRRSLPLSQNYAQSLYTYWLLELLPYCGLEGNDVRSSVPARPVSGLDYRFTIQCTGSLSQLTNFLFEFYCAPILHRITSITLKPMEGNQEKMTFFLTVNALALRPHRQGDMYPMAYQLPTGWWYPRLAPNDLSFYQSIASRNLLQTAQGGVDRADYTRLTAIIQSGDQIEVWFSVLTDDSVIKAKRGDLIQSGSFSGKFVEVYDQKDIVIDRDGSRWLLSTGEYLKEAFALPPETAGTL